MDQLAEPELAREAQGRASRSSRATGRKRTRSIKQRPTPARIVVTITKAV
jgi:hypothetical protein